MFEWIKNLFGVVGAKLRMFLSSPGGKIVREALADIVETMGAVALSVLLEEAKKKVGSLDPLDMPKMLKAEQAADYLKGYAIRIGVAAGENTIQLAIRLAVQSLRAAQKE